MMALSHHEDLRIVDTGEALEFYMDSEKIADIPHIEGLLIRLSRSIGFTRFGRTKWAGTLYIERGERLKRISLGVGYGRLWYR